MPELLSTSDDSNKRLIALLLRQSCRQKRAGSIDFLRPELPTSD
jgi:hypothetical protein